MVWECDMDPAGLCREEERLKVEMLLDMRLWVLLEPAAAAPGRIEAGMGGAAGPRDPVLEALLSPASSILLNVPAPPYVSLPDRRGLIDALRCLGGAADE